MKILSLVLLGLTCLSLPLGATPSDTYSMGAEVMRFHLAPSRQRFEQLEAGIDRLATTLRAKGNEADRNMAVFLARAAEMHHWPITGKSPIAQTAREIAAGKSALARYVRDSQAVDLGKLDIWWASFFATGESKYLALLLSHAREPRPGEHAADFMVPAMAAWSFESNCRQDPTVLAFAREALAKNAYPEKTAFLKQCVAAAGGHTSAPATAFPPQDHPARMTKIVTKRLGAPTGSFAAQPLVTYRAGTRYCRTEEALDRVEGIHGLSIVDEPNIWMINLVDHTGRHIVDPGPTFDVHAPILAAVRKKGEPNPEKAFEGLEFGNELQFFRAQHARKASSREIDGRSYPALSLTRGPITVTLTFDPATDKPVEVDATNDGKGELAIRYLAYETDLPFQKALFAPPGDILMTEAR